jgi:hypothetical protein
MTIRRERAYDDPGFPLVFSAADRDRNDAVVLEQYLKLLGAR